MKYPDQWRLEMKHCFYALLLVSLSACSADRSETGQVADPNPTIIVTYQVPPATENQIESVINSLLGVGEDGERIGRARVLPNRMVVVSAPAAVPVTGRRLGRGEVGRPEAGSPVAK